MTMNYFNDSAEFELLYL